MSKLMKAAVYIEPGRIVLEDRPMPEIGPLDALMRVTTTTICGTDIHILEGEHPVESGRIIGHEPVGVIESLALPSLATRKASAPSQGLSRPAAGQTPA